MMYYRFLMARKKNSFLFLAIGAILFASPFVPGNAFAENQDKKDAQPPINCTSLGSIPEILECLKNEAEKSLSISGLRAAMDAIRHAIDILYGGQINLQNQIDELKNQNKLLQSQIDELNAKLNK